MKLTVDILHPGMVLLLKSNRYFMKVKDISSETRSTRFLKGTCFTILETEPIQVTAIGFKTRYIWLFADNSKWCDIANQNDLDYYWELIL